MQEIAAQIEGADSDLELLQKLADVQQQLERELDELLERWTYLNELAEKMG